MDRQRRMKGIFHEQKSEAKYQTVDASGDSLEGNVLVNGKEVGEVVYKNGVLVGGNRDKKG